MLAKPFTVRRQFGHSSPPAFNSGYATGASFGPRRYTPHFLHLFRGLAMGHAWRVFVWCLGVLLLLLSVLTWCFHCIRCFPTRCRSDPPSSMRASNRHGLSGWCPFWILWSSCCFRSSGGPTTRCFQLQVSSSCRWCRWASFLPYRTLEAMQPASDGTCALSAVWRLFCPALAIRLFWLTASMVAWSPGLLLPMRTLPLEAIIHGGLDGTLGVLTPAQDWPTRIASWHAWSSLRGLSKTRCTKPFLSPHRYG